MRARALPRRPPPATAAASPHAAWPLISRAAAPHRPAPHRRCPLLCAAPTPAGRPATAADGPALEALAATLEAEECGAGGSASSSSAAAAPGVCRELLAEWAEEAGASFAPVAAVLGGVVSNNVVKAISGVGQPAQNFFFFSLADGQGVVEDYGS